MSEYECAVYREETDALALAVRDLVEERTASIDDARVKQALVVAAVVTALQLLDGADLERDQAMRADGFGGRLAFVVDEWRRRWA